MLEKFEQLYIHPSQFPGQVFQDYIDSFTSQKINHKFHYDSVKQSQKWLKIHESFSPAQNDESCVNAYVQCCQKTAELINSISADASHDNAASRNNVIALGCGGGEKDKLLVSLLNKEQQVSACYPVDVSASLAIISAQKLREASTELSVQPIVCDLLHAEDLVSLIDRQDNRNIITFFGMIPNFLPDEILPILTSFLQPDDLLLFSANLAPGADYLEGVQTVFPQYNNELTKEWLITVLLDAGVGRQDGSIEFQIEPDSKNQHIQRIAAYFNVKNDVSFSIENQPITWSQGDKVRLFFSYRYTTQMIKDLLKAYNIQVLDFWEAENAEEGVYLCQRV